MQLQPVSSHSTIHERISHSFNSTGQPISVTYILANRRVHKETWMQLPSNFHQSPLSPYTNHGHGGYCSRRTPLAAINTQAPHPRLQLPTSPSTNAPSLSGLVVVDHATTGADTQLNHTAFHTELTQLTTNVPQSRHFIGGVDLNSHMGTHNNFNIEC
eukprot:3707291-Amphidinium_carterae.1